MNFIQKMKKDRKYRFRVVVILVLFFIIWGNTTGNQEKKEAWSQYCDQYNYHNLECTVRWPTVPALKYVLGCTYGDREDLCRADSQCVVARDLSEPIVEIKACYASVVDSQIAELEEDCQNCASPYKDGKWLCRACTDEEIKNPTPTCNTVMREIGSVLREIAPDLSCKTAFYLTIVGGAFIILLIFATM